MATITINNTNTNQIAREFLYALEIGLDNDQLNPKEATASFIKRPSESASIFREIIKSLNRGDQETKTLSISDTKATIQTSLFSDETSDSNLTINLSGSKFNSGNNATITSATSTYEFDIYFDQNKDPKNLDAQLSGSSRVKLNYSPVTTPSGEVLGDIYWQSESSNDKGFFFDDKLENFDFNSISNMSGNLTIAPDGTISGSINTYNLRDNDTNANSKVISNLSLISKGGITVNLAQQYSGIIDSLSFSKTKQSATSWSGGISYKETATNPELLKTLSDFLANEATLENLTSILMSNNDRITATGEFTTINGYLGNDSIRLGTGKDTVQFTTNLGSNNVDSIRGFQIGQDRISISKEIFSGYQGANNFKIIGTTLDADDRILYNNKTGQLFYDADGSGAGLAVQFATLVGKPNLSAGDISVI